MDARDERAAAILVTIPYARVFPNPDGTLGESDRQHLALSYARQTASLSPGHTYQHRQWAHFRQSFS